MTSLDTEYFRLQLPGVWTQNSQTDPTLWQYASESGNELLSISVLQYQKPPRPEDRATYLQQYLDVRQQSEQREARDAKLELTSPKVEEQGAAVVGFYSGFSPTTNRRFANFTIHNQRGIVSFYYEAVDTDADNFKTRQQDIIGRVQVAD